MILCENALDTQVTVIGTIYNNDEYHGSVVQPVAMNSCSKNLIYNRFSQSPTFGSVCISGLSVFAQGPQELWCEELRLMLEIDNLTFMNHSAPCAMGLVISFKHMYTNERIRTLNVWDVGGNEP